MQKVKHVPHKFYFIQLNAKRETVMFHNITKHSSDLILFDLCLTPLSAIFQLYHGRPDLVVGEAGVPGENHRPWASN